MVKPLSPSLIRSAESETTHHNKPNSLLVPIGIQNIVSKIMCILWILGGATSMTPMTSFNINAVSILHLSVLLTR